MKAVGYRKCLPIDQADALIDLDIAAPAAPTGRDMLVAIQSVSAVPYTHPTRPPKRPVCVLVGGGAFGKSVRL